MRCKVLRNWAILSSVLNPERSTSSLMIWSIGFSAVWAVRSVFLRFGVPLLDDALTPELIRVVLDGFGKDEVVRFTSCTVFLIWPVVHVLGANPMPCISKLSDAKTLKGFSLNSGISLKSKFVEVDSQSSSKKLIPKNRRKFNIFISVD